jgi:hypothetical protein
MLHIGISGPIASGKSTLAKQLAQRATDHGYAAHIVPFAAGIRELVALESFAGSRVPLLAGMISGWGWDATKAHLAAIMIDEYMTQYPSTPGVKNRRLLQYVGTEVGREFLHTDFWIYRTHQLIRQYNSGVIDFAFSDDLRFDNEAVAVDVHIQIQVYGERERCYRERRLQFGGEYTFSNHKSEMSLTLPPLLVIPVCFTDSEVDDLFTDLDRIRRLRY